MNFFHCNICYVQPRASSERKFNLTSCGHIICSFCEKNTGTAQCKVCNVPCKLMVLSNSLPDELKMYFSDLTKEIKKFIKILVIQHKHCKIYMEEYVPQLEAKYQSAKLNLDKQNCQIDGMKKEIEQLMEQVNNLKRENSRLLEFSRNGIPDTPISCGNENRNEFRMDSNLLSTQMFSNRDVMNCRANTSNFFLSPYDSSTGNFSCAQNITPLEMLQNRRHSRSSFVPPQRNLQGRTSQLFSKAPNAQDANEMNRSSTSMSQSWYPLNSSKNQFEPKTGNSFHNL